MEKKYNISELGRVNKYVGIIVRTSFSAFNQKVFLYLERGASRVSQYMCGWQRTGVEVGSLIPALRI